MGTALADEIVSLLKPIMDNVALVLSNGIIIFSNFEEDAIHPLVKYVKGIESRLQAGFFLRQDYLLTFRVSDHLFILALSNLPDSDIIPLFSRLFADYSAKFNILYENPPKTLGDILKTIIFSMAREQGPEPITWVPANYPDGEILEYSTKAMLILAGELGGASQNVVSYRPFINKSLLGIIFLFEIPNARARGLAYDSAIVLMVDYRDRALIYEIASKLESLLARASKQLIDIWQNKRECQKVLEDLKEALHTVPLHVNTLAENIKQEMLLSVHDLRKI